MDAPEARYVERDGALLAYQVVGDGSAELLFVGESAQHFDLAWTDPDIHEAYERAATWSRTAYMQMRGLGLSERIQYWPTPDQQADDVLAVLDAANMRHATLVGSLTTCGAVALAAAKAPDRVAGLVLFKGVACGPLSPDAQQNGWTVEQAAAYAAGWRAVAQRWGSGSTLEMWDPVCATPYNRRLMAMLERCSASPVFAQTYVAEGLAFDYTACLPAIQAPTRVLYAPTAREPEAAVRRTAELIANATFHALEPTPPGASIGDTYVEVWRHVEEVATGQSRQPDTGRFLGTVLFTDLVASTELLVRLGDSSYRELLAAHERQVRLHVEQAGGRLLNVTGDGTFSLFDGPTKAVRCADAIRRDAEQLGVQVRAGVHAGELERTGHDVTGLAVHIGARVGAQAGPGEVLVSRTVHDVVAGSGLSFTSRGERELKGVPGRWELFSLVSAGEQAALLPVEASMATVLDRAALRTARSAPGAMRAVLRIGNAVQRRRNHAAV